MPLLRSCWERVKSPKSPSLSSLFVVVVVDSLVHFSIHFELCALWVRSFVSLCMFFFLLSSSICNNTELHRGYQKSRRRDAKSNKKIRRTHFGEAGAETSAKQNRASFFIRHQWVRIKSAIHLTIYPKKNCLQLTYFFPLRSVVALLILDLWPCLFTTNHLLCVCVCVFAVNQNSINWRTRIHILKSTIFSIVTKWIVYGA